MGHITKNHLKEEKIALPNDYILLKIQEKLETYYELILANSLEIKRLIETRDYLLPKLLSGEIDLSEEEKEVEQVL
ncbi:hypothetical protein GCM10008983_00090 [Lentibacillus halophilus]|uniref:Type I restriction enzyme, S subunit n=2 Tax=Lentibacillus halophilus TaxID=295065 RepID=A0ABN0Z1B7_9BACI